MGPNVGANEIDFYSVILHELGHAMNLKHAFSTCPLCGDDFDKTIMFPILPPGLRRDDFYYGDKKGVEWMLDESEGNLDLSACPKSIKTGDNCTTSTKEYQYLNETKIFPNPYNSNSLSLTIMTEYDILNVKVYNSFGSEFANNIEKNVDSSYSMEFHSPPPAGVCFIELKFEEGSIFKKLIIYE